MTLRLGRWSLLTASYRPTQRPKQYAFRLYLNARQIEIGVGDRGWTACLVKSDLDANGKPWSRVRT